MTNKFDEYLEMDIDKLDRLKKAAEVIEIMQRNELQRDIGIKSRERAAAAVSHQQSDAVIAKLQATQLQRQEDTNLSNDFYQHRYQFDGHVSPDSVRVCIDILNHWSYSTRDNPCEMEVVLTSPGGDVIQGFRLYDYLRQLSGRGHHITTSVLGVAASMSAVLLQAGDTRIMGRNGWLMLHEGSLGTSGTVGQVQDSAEWSKRMALQMVTLVADRAMKSDATFPLTQAEIEKEVIGTRRDWWISSDVALRGGLVDKLL